MAGPDRPSPRPGIPTSSSSASASTPLETAPYGLLQPDGPATPAKDRQPQTSSPNAYTPQQKKNFPSKRIRTDFSDSDSDWEENFYILRHTLCPAVLTEYFFMDNPSDLEYLQSRAGKQAVVDTTVEGIVEWLESKI